MNLNPVPSKLYIVVVINFINPKVTQLIGDNHGRPKGGKGVMLYVFRLFEENRMFFVVFEARSMFLPAPLEKTCVTHMVTTYLKIGKFFSLF